MKLLFGISFGYPDVEHPAAHYNIDRIALTHSIFHHSAVQPSRG